jgi:hypothetical protein
VSECESRTGASVRLRINGSGAQAYGAAGSVAAVAWGVRMGFRPHAGLAAGFCRGNTVEPNNGLSNAWTIAKIKTLNVDC